MAEITFEEAAGASPGVAPAGPPPLPAAKPARAPAPKGEVSFEEATGGFVTGEPQQGGAQRALSLGKQAGGEVAAVADFMANLLVAFPLQVGAELGGTVGAMAVGDKRPYARGQEIGKKLSEPFANPAQKILAMLDSGEIYEQAKTTQGLNLLSEKIKAAGRWVERKTQGKIQSEAVEMFFDTAMLGAGGRGTDLVARRRAEMLKKPSGIEQRATYQEGPPVDTKPRFKWTPSGPEAVAELQQIAKSGAERETALHEEVTQPPKPRLQGPLAISREVETQIEALGGKEAGKADPRILPIVAAAAGSALAGRYIYNEAERSGRSVWEVLKDFGRPDYTKQWEEYRKREEEQQQRIEKAPVEETPEGTFLAKAKELAPLALLAGAVKAKGGMWHPEAVERLSDPLASRLHSNFGSGYSVADVRRADITKPGMSKAFIEGKPLVQWSDRAVRNYLNKHAGTETDPLKDIEIPFGEGTKRWEEVTDLALRSRPLEKTEAASLPEAVIEGYKSGRISPQESVWNLGRDFGEPMTTRERDTGRAANALIAHLSHVGDYLRQNVPPEKLQNYDLVRAVKETAEADKRAAAAMEKSAAASMKDMPVYKDYGNGFKWVELKLPEKLTEEQKKGVRRATKDEKIEHETDAAIEAMQFDGRNLPRANYVAVESDGKPIVNSYTGDPAYGPTPEEAWLSGQLAREGNQMGHCVGGYCEGVASGESKIFSLRDSKGRSHVTVEVRPDRTGDVPAFKKIQADDILQIKGKQNRAPNKEYLPYVQDFVKSGKWGEVGDLENTGLVKRGDKYMTKEEYLIEDRKVPPGFERGFATPEQTARIAAVTAGALIGAQASQDPWLGGAVGALAGGFAARFGPSVGRAVMDATAATLKGEPMKGLKELVPGPITAALKEDTRIRIKAEMDAAEAFARREELRRNRLVNDTVEAVPEQTRREAISHWLEGNRAFTLSSTEQQQAGQIRRWFDRVGQMAQQAGVVKDLLSDYVTHVYGKEAQGLLDQMMAARTTGATTSPFAKPRVGPPTIAEVNAWMLSKGKQPIVSDIAQIVEAYGNSMTKAVANKLLIDSLKKRTASFEVNGKRVEHPLVAPSFKAPGNYVNFGKGGLVAHPDIAPALRFAIDADNPILLMRGVEAVNTAIKRSAVSFSLFHAKALADAFTGAAHLGKKGMMLGAAAGLGVGVLNNDPITYALIGAGIGMAAKPLKIVGQAALPKVFGENKFVRALRKEDPSMAKLIDLSFEGGLMYSLRKGPLAVEEVGNTFYQGMEWAQKSLDAIIPGGGMAVKGLEKLNHAVDGFMWERLHTAMKLEIFAQKYEVLLQNNAKAHVADPRVKLFSEKEIAERAASFTNDIFGGLNWRRIAEETRTRWGRDLAMGIYSPAGRRVMRLAMFAPDWTISTTRAAVKAFGPLVGQEAGGGLKGLVSPRTLTDLHRQYMLRSAFYYLMVGDGLNYALNGKHLWQEDDPTYIHMRDGRRIQYSKHTMEPYHWLQHPIQQGINKMGQVPREIINQMLGTEYLNPKVGKTGQVFAGPKMEGSRLGHAGRTVSPIGVQQLAGGGTAAGAMGALGMPIYGKTKAEIARMREERKRKRRLEGK